jgi:basic membrane protein A and related proteins
MKRLLAIAAVAALGAMMAACGGSGGGTSGCSKTYQVGLVTDVGKITDKSFNENSWQGVQDAIKANKCISAKYIETAQQSDYQKNLGQFASYDMVIAVGGAMATDANTYAKAHSKQAVVTVDGNPKGAGSNITRLVFQEDQPGFLVGALAAMMSKSGVVGGVYGLKSIDPVVRYAEGYENGARHVNPNVQVKTVYQGAGDGEPFNNPSWGKASAAQEIAQGADVIFGAGGNTGNGALVAANEKSLPCIGVDVDQFYSYPDVASCLVTSAQKHLAAAVKQAVTDGASGKLKGGMRVYNMQNQGVGIAPYHNWESKVPADVKQKLEDIEKKLADGSLKTGVEIPF